MTTASSRVRLHDLAFRRDGEEWIVGRPATGEFVALPEQAVTFLRALGDGVTVGEAKAVSDRVHDDDMDAVAFVGDVAELGFVASIDDQPVGSAEPGPPSLAWLQPGHVRWLLAWPTWIAAAVLIAAGFTVAAAHRELHGYAGFFAVRDPGANMLLAAALTMLVIGMHEFSHLAVARAARVPGWIGWGSRLVFLVAQTTVPGLWMADRATRIRVFLAGMTADLLMFSGCSAALALTPTASLPGRVLGQLSLLLLLGVAEQFALYMRTDIYYVLQDLVRCKNLYADSLGHLSYQAARRLGLPGPLEDPLTDLPAAERGPVRAYAGALLVGTAATLAVYACFEVPIAVALVARTLRELGHGIATGTLAPAADGTVALAVLVIFQGLLVRAVLRKHRARLRRGLALLRSASLRRRSKPGKRAGLLADCDPRL